MRVFLVLALLLAATLAVPLTAAAPNPEIGYIPGEDESPPPPEPQPSPGSTVDYEISLLVAPPDGKTRVDLELGYDETTAFAPPTHFFLRRSNEQTSEDLGVLSGTTQRIIKPLTITEPRGFEYILLVEVTIPADQAPGDYHSRLTLLARDPSTESSSPGIIYDYLYHIPNTPPTAAFTFSAADQHVTFDASSSSDPSNEPLTYSWSFGDGTTGQGVTISHTFPASGAYVVRLTVTDPQGATDTATQTVTVTANARPVANFQTQFNLQEVTFDGTLSYDPEGGALTYAWDFGDGGSSTQPKPVHAYAAEGTYGVSLTVTDPQGLSGSTSKSIAVNGENHAPEASFTFTRSSLRVNFTNTASDPDGDVLTFLWDFGDGRTSTDQDPVHFYATAGTYRVKLTATDDHNAVDDLTRNVAVTAATTSASDSDGDGISDSAEEAAGSDPDNAASTPSDRDGDGRSNDKDNCPDAANANQADLDGDGIGNTCDAVTDGADADPDGDGKPSADDNCPADNNPTQADLDGDKRGDACDSDLDGDGTVNEADAFPRDRTEWMDTDRDGTGNNKDTDDDNDELPDEQEISAGSDPLDRQDPPFRPTAATAFRLDNGTNHVSWRAESDPRVTGYLVWREASPLALVSSFEDDGRGLFSFFDLSPPSHARYHVQARLGSDVGLLYAQGDSRITNWVTGDGASLEECADPTDSDQDGLCDALEVQLGLDPDDADSDNDGLPDGDELLEVGTLAYRRDTDGDGVSDGKEIDQGTDPFDPSSHAARAINWSLVAIGVLAATVVVMGILLVRKKKA